MNPNTFRCIVSLSFLPFILNSSSDSDMYYCVDWDCQDFISRGKTLLNYVGKTDQHLSFRQNEDIKILGKPVDDNGPDWIGTVRRKIGLVPKSMVREDQMGKHTSKFRYPLNLLPLWHVQNNEKEEEKPNAKLDDLNLLENVQSEETDDPNNNNTETKQSSEEVDTKGVEDLDQSDDNKINSSLSGTEESSGSVEEVSVEEIVSNESTTTPLPAIDENITQEDNNAINLEAKLDNINLLENVQLQETDTVKNNTETKQLSEVDTKSVEEESVVDNKVNSSATGSEESSSSVEKVEEVVVLEELSTTPLPVIDEDVIQEDNNVKYLKAQLDDRNLLENVQPEDNTETKQSSEEVDTKGVEEESVDDNKINSSLSGTEESPGSVEEVKESVVSNESTTTPLPVIDKDVIQEDNNVKYLKAQLDDRNLLENVQPEDNTEPKQLSEVDTKGVEEESVVDNKLNTPFSGSEESSGSVKEVKEEIISDDPTTTPLPVIGESIIQQDKNAINLEAKLDDIDLLENVQSEDNTEPKQLSEVDTKGVEEQAVDDKKVNSSVTGSEESSSSVEELKKEVVLEEPSTTPLPVIDEDVIQEDNNVKYLKAQLDDISILEKVQEDANAELVQQDMKILSEVDSKSAEEQSDGKENNINDPNNTELKVEVVPENPTTQVTQDTTPLPAMADGTEQIPLLSQVHEDDHHHDHEHSHHHHHHDHEQDPKEQEEGSSSFILVVKHLSSTLLTFLPEHLQDTVLDVDDALVFTGIIALTLVSICVPYFLIEGFFSVRPLKKKVVELNKSLWKVSTAYENQQDEFEIYKKKALAYDEDKKRVEQLEYELVLLKKLEGKQKEQVTKYQKELKTHKELTTDMQSFLDKEAEKKRKILEEKDKLKTTATSLKEALRRTTDELQDAQLEASTAIMDLELARQSNETLNMKAAILEKELGELKSKLVAEVDRRRVAEDERDEVLKSKSDLETEFADLKKICHKYEETVDDLNTEISHKENELEALKETLGEDSPLVDIAEVKAKLVNAEEQATSLQSRVEAITLENSSLSRNFKEATSSLSSIQKERDEALNRLQVLEAWFKQKEEELRKAVERYEAEKNIRGKDKDDLVRMIEEKSEENKQLTNSMEAFKGEFEETKLQHRNEMRALEAKSHESWLSLCQAERKAQDARKEAELLRQKLTALTKEKEGEGEELNGEVSMYPLITPDMVPLPLPDDVPSYFGLGDGFMPPPPLPLDGEREPHRPAPLGRLSPNYSDLDDTLSPIRRGNRRERDDYSDEDSTASDDSPRHRRSPRGGWDRDMQHDRDRDRERNNATTERERRRRGPRTSSPVPQAFNL